MWVPISHQRSGSSVCCGLFFFLLERFRTGENKQSWRAAVWHGKTFSKSKKKSQIIQRLRKLVRTEKMSGKWTWTLLSDSRTCVLSAACPQDKQTHLSQGAISAGCVLAKNNNLAGLRKVNDSGCGATVSRLHLNFSKVSRGWRVKRMEDCSVPDCADTDSQLPSLWARRRGKSWFLSFFSEIRKMYSCNVLKRCQERKIRMNKAY